MEVMVGIAIVAIISVPLLNMFATSFKVGRYSYNIDNANAAALTTVENFRAGRVTYALDAGGKYAQTTYYDYNWTPLSTVTGEESAPAGAVFKATMDVTGTTSAEVDSSLLPQLTKATGETYSVVLDLALNAQPSLGLTLSKSGGTYTLSCTSALLGGNDSVTIPESDLPSSTLPLIVNNGENTNMVTLNVEGLPNVELGLFIFGDSDPAARHVNVSVSGGGVTIARLEKGIEAMRFDKLILHVQVVRLEDGLVISDYQTMSHVVQ